MNIKDIVENYGIELKPVGKLFIGLCPFHNDKNNPNLTIYTETNSWYCYGPCQTGGDPIAFIAKMEGVHPNEIKKKMAFMLFRNRLKNIKTNNAGNIDFKKEALFLTAKICREYLTRNPRDLDNVIMILNKLDAKFNTTSTISYQDSIRMIEKFRHYIYMGVKNENKND